MTKSSKKKYFSDLIGESYKNWVNTKIIFDGGTGSGKTYFIINILGVYAKKNKKKMLYLCNRAELKEQIIADAKKAHVDDVMYVTTYQAIQNRLRGGEIIPHYDYVIADECHYFTNDALFNEYTDKSYRYVMTQEQSVVIYISATAKVFFKWLRKRNLVAEDHYFLIPKSYDYVNKVYFYDKKLLIPKVDQILQTEKESKIIIFCNSTTRMLELYKTYGENANYVASKSAKNVKEICDEHCIYEHKDGTVTFDKRILVTTKVIDNGVNIKDKNVKHIFSEILDVDSTIQALGRKRKISDDDSCTFYLKNYGGQAIQALINSNEHQTEPIEMYKKDYVKFLRVYGQNRKRIRSNQIFYTEFDVDKNKNRLTYNKMRLKKYQMDNDVLQEMKETSYKSVMAGILGLELADRIEELDIHVEEKDDFLEYMKSIEGKWLYAEERKELIKRFEDIGVKLRRAGINTFNGALQDNYKNRYKCRFRNKQLDANGKLTKKSLVDKRRTLENGADNPNRDQKYWILE